MHKLIDLMPCENHVPIVNGIVDATPLTLTLLTTHSTLYTLSKNTSDALRSTRASHTNDNYLQQLLTSESNYPPPCQTADLLISISPLPRILLPWRKELLLPVVQLDQLQLGVF